MNPSAFAAKAHAFVADVEHPDLDEADHHHLARVLRLRTGDELTVADGQGAWRRCRFGDELEPDGPIEHEERAVPEIVIGFALVKGSRPELVVQKLTEIGVDRIVPFVAARSVVRWDDERAAHHHARLAIVAREAAMQSRRAWLPSVDALSTFEAMARCEGAILADRGGEPPSLSYPVVLVGPEGGWSDEERSTGLEAVTLGDTVLRAETAAIVAGAALCGLRSNVFGQAKRHGG